MKWASGPVGWDGIIICDQTSSLLNSLSGSLFLSWDHTSVCSYLLEITAVCSYLSLSVQQLELIYVALILTDNTETIG